jgi:DNA modification methylase
MTDAPVVDVRNGDCRELIAAMPSESVDAIVTDPPYELGFMGKGWDASGVAYDVNLWRECLRVLKPGGHLLAFGGTRTYHRMACAIEDAGFEIRDSIQWLYGSGFPKSHDVSKGIDKAAGAEREVVGVNPMVNVYRNRGPFDALEEGDIYEKSPITAPATDAAKQWQGWGTALKPAHEPIVVARKPLIGTVAANVQQHGTGALNIDAARIGRAEGDSSIAGNRTATFGTQETKPGGDGSGGWKQNDAGRWPANVITDGSIDAEWVRYFYVAKPSRRERNAGLEHLDEVTKGSNFGNNGARPHTSPDYKYEANTRNIHPTVKPLALMRYLVRLVTPPGGTVLEPFAGSGTTLAAAVLEGFNAIGCELTEDYLPIIEGRVQWAQQERANKTESLFPE